MFSSKFVDPSAIEASECIRDHENCVRWIAHHACESLVKIFRLTHAEWLHPSPNCPSGVCGSWYRSVMPRSFTFQSIATVRNVGTMSLSTSRRLGASSMAISETPVMLPLGRDRLLTKPVATGSPPRIGCHDWNGCRGILGGDGCRTAKGQDHVYVARHEILRDCGSCSSGPRWHGVRAPRCDRACSR